MKTLIALLCICISLLPINSFCQVLLGKTLDEYGEPAVKIKVSTSKDPVSTITGKDGKFQLLIKNLPDTLIFSSPGFEPYKVALTEKIIKDPSFEIVLLTKRTWYNKIKPYTVPVNEEVTISKTLEQSVAFRLNNDHPTLDSNDISKVYPIPDSTQGDMLFVSITDSLGNISRYDTVYSSGIGNILPAPNISPAQPVMSIAYDKSPDLSDYNYAPIYLDRSHSYNIKTSHQKDSSLYTVQLLTAAELNDFYKWEMWGDLSNGEFSEWSDFWTMTPTKRYTVQLLNNDFASLANRPVYLIDKVTKKKIWSAVTDNTGKAELWADFDGKQNRKGGYMIKDEDGNIISDAIPFEKGINHIVTNGSCDVSNAVDIAFVVDATGSMGDELGYFKFELEDVLRSITSNNSNLDIRTSALFYRDKGDDYVTQHIDFTSDILKVINFIKVQHADQGGDDPEAVDSALYVALNKLTWRKEARTRLMFLVLDAPPHDEAKADIYKLIVKAASMGVRIIPVACSGSGKNNEYLLRTMALATNGTYVFLTDQSGIGEAHTEVSTDSYTVELMNGLLQRIIEQFSYVSECNAPAVAAAIEPPVRQTMNIAKIRIYPNPTSGKFSIASDKELKEVFVADFTGKVLMKLSGTGKSNWQVNIDNYPSGTYLIKYVTVDDEWGTEKIILMH